MSCLNGTLLVIPTAYLGYWVGECFRLHLQGVGCSAGLPLDSFPFAFWILIRCPYNLFLVYAVVVSYVYISTRTNKFYILLVFPYFCGLPYLLSTAMCTGYKPWRYQLADSIVWFGFVAMVLFLAIPSIKGENTFPGKQTDDPSREVEEEMQ